MTSIQIKVSHNTDKVDLSINRNTINLTLKQIREIQETLEFATSLVTNKALKKDMYYKHILYLME